MLAALAAAVLVWTDEADSRPAGALSLGRSGARLFMSPARAVTSPKAVVALDRSLSPAGGHPPSGGGSLDGLFTRPGLLGAFAGGFLGAGLLGVLFGQGLFGGLGSAASFLGLLFQLVLLALLARLIWVWWHGRHAPAFAGLSPRQLADAYTSSRDEMLAGLGALDADVSITPSDHDALERLLGEIQSACNRHDLDALRTRVTPDMLSHVAEQLTRDERRGAVDVLSGVKLIPGDLVEAWREGDTEYATVAVHVPPNDRVVERGRGMDDSAERPIEARELCTFERTAGQPWLLAAIQQAS